MTKVLSRKSIFRSRFFTVNEDEVELPTGSRRVYHNVIRDPAVSVFPLDDDYNIYLIDQYRYLHGKRLLEAVAGMVDENEATLDTAKRELKEEAGITAEEWIPLGVQVAAGSISTWNQPLFVAKKLNLGKQQLEESEDIKVVKISLDEAVQKVLHGEIETSASVTGILMIDKMRQEGKI